MFKFALFILKPILMTIGCMGVIFISIYSGMCVSGWISGSLGVILGIVICCLFCLIGFFCLFWPWLYRTRVEKFISAYYRAKAL